MTANQCAHCNQREIALLEERQIAEAIRLRLRHLEGAEICRQALEHVFRLVTEEIGATPGDVAGLFKRIKELRDLESKAARGSDQP